MKYSLDVSTAGTYADARLLADLAAEAEAVGWDGFFVWDAVFAHPPSLPMVDPWIALAAIAMQTKRIRIGAMVTPLVRRRPWQVAREKKGYIEDRRPNANMDPYVVTRLITETVCSTFDATAPKAATKAKR